MVNNINKNYLGIDISKDKADIYFNGKGYVIKNEEKAISSFIKEEIADQPVVLSVLESTGGYERQFIKAFNKANIPIHKAHPNKVHSFAKASGHYAKTDKLDALLLYKYAIFLSQEQRGDEIIPEIIEKLNTLKKVASNMEESLHAAQCRLKQIPKHGHKYVRKEILFLKKNIAFIYTEIKEIISNDSELKEKARILKSMKGIGEKVSSLLLAELPELGKLNKKEIASLCGLAPRTYQSGKSAFAGRIHGGRFHVRKGIYMAALVASRYSSKFRCKYEMLLAKGKVKKVALVAIMRQIIVCLNAMVKKMQLCNF